MPNPEGPPVIQFACPHCGHNSKVNDRHAGKETACPHCRGRLVVPAPAPFAKLQAPVIQARDDDDEDDDEADPWYYAVVRLAAGVMAVASVLWIAGVLYVSATVLGMLGDWSTGQRVALFVAMVVIAIVGVLLLLAVPALMLVLADMGRTLRQIRRRR
jgi:hypothetical protein